MSFYLKKNHQSQQQWKWNIEPTMFPIYTGSMQIKPIKEKLRLGTCWSTGCLAVPAYETQCSVMKQKP
jgi:hypothetical protein